MVKLEDTLLSKSSGPKGLAGPSPASGTKYEGSPALLKSQHEPYTNSI